VKQGIKRSLILTMFVASLFVSPSSTSALQETTLPVASVIQMPSSGEADVASGLPPVVLGTASWYGRSSPRIKKRTASTEIFDDKRMTCASWKFPLKTRLKITNLDNGKSVICVVNDRGPAKRLGRAIDLTRAAFKKISDPRKGLVTVSVMPFND
jgi:rare lipoprotein A